MVEYESFKNPIMDINTVETAYKVAICPRGNLPYMQIYLIADLKLLLRGIYIGALIYILYK